MADRPTSDGLCCHHKLYESQPLCVRRLCPDNIMGCRGEMIHSIPWWNNKSDTSSQGRWGRIQPIPRRTGHLDREVILDTARDGLQICRELCSHSEHMWEHFFVVPGAQNFYCARGTGLLKYQGHKLIVVPWPWCSQCHDRGVGFKQVRQVFYFYHDPTFDWHWSIITLIIISSWLKYHYLNSFCTVKGFKSFEVLNNNSSNF